jgi:hypothetical protein
VVQRWQDAGTPVLLFASMLRFCHGRTTRQYGVLSQAEELDCSKRGLAPDLLMLKVVT